MELMADQTFLFRGKFRLPDELANEVPVTLLGGHAAGRGVRLAEQSGVGEGSHVVTNRRRTDVQVVPVNQPLRAYRLSDLNVLMDDQPEQGLLSFGKVSHGRISI
jgi:hypothetical protein